MLADQRIDDLVQSLARHHLIELIKGQFDAVVGDAACGKL